MNKLIKKQTKNKETIPVFFATDDNYMPFLLVTLESIVRNMNNDYNYIFYILNNGISAKYKDMVKKFNTYNSKVEFVSVYDKLKKIGNMLHTRDYYSKTTYYRLFIPTLFPEYNKALYLDCDIAVQGDIAELYNTEIGTNLLGAIPDQAVLATPEFLSYTENFLGIKKGNYFNAGIILMNLHELRKMKFEEKFLNLLSSFTFNVAQDQDYLNVICKGKITYISETWNISPINNKFSDNDVKLVHYNLSFKPWHYDDIVYGDIFWKYAKLSGMENQIMEIKNNYDEEKKLNDKICGERLVKLADYQSKLDITFSYLLTNGHINKVTYLKENKKNNLIEQLLTLMQHA